MASSQKEATDADKRAKDADEKVKQTESKLKEVEQQSEQRFVALYDYQIQVRL